MNAAPKWFGASRAWPRKYFCYCKISKKNFREFGVSFAGNGCFCLPACENMGRKGRGINFSLGALRLSQNSTLYIFSFPLFFAKLKSIWGEAAKGKREGGGGKEEEKPFLPTAPFPFSARYMAIYQDHKKGGKGRNLKEGGEEEGNRSICQRGSCAIQYFCLHSPTNAKETIQYSSAHVHWARDWYENYKKGNNSSKLFSWGKRENFFVESSSSSFFSPNSLFKKIFFPPLLPWGGGVGGREMKSKIVLKVGETEINPRFKEEKSRGPPIRGAQIPPSLLPAYLHLFLLLLEKYFWQRGDREEWIGGNFPLFSPHPPFSAFFVAFCSWHIRRGRRRRIAFERLSLGPWFTVVAYIRSFFPSPPFPYIAKRLVQVNPTLS